jgi:hypothetical protein
LLKDLIFILNLLKTFIIKPAFLISFVVAIPTSAPTFITPIVSAPAIAELILPSTPKIAAALLPPTYILTKPQV